MKIVLVRHPAPLIQPGICYGRLDVPADPDAVEESGKLTASLAPPGTTRLWTSPARRCRDLADAIAPLLAATQIVDLRLQELDFGAWEGMAWDAVPRVALDAWAASPETFAPPGGESGASLILRVRDFCAELLRDQQNCVVISHGGPLKVLAALLDKKPVDLLAPPPSIGSARIVTWTTIGSSA